MDIHKTQIYRVFIRFRSFHRKTRLFCLHLKWGVVEGPIKMTKSKWTVNSSQSQRITNNVWWYKYLRAEREKSKKDGESPVEPISSCRDEHGYVPTVGRWGSEWPSWLEEADAWCQPQGQARGPWIRGAPLPLPVWGHYESPALTVDTVEQYEELASSVELETQRLLRERRYDTVDNVLR